VKSLSAQSIRTEFLEYFQRQGHQKVRSSSLIPSNDPTVLLTTAGMQQFKPYFLGEQEAPAGRLTTAQKCFRTSDIEEVGDSTHDTFFEMLGNFSVGDYFKKEAIAFAWDLLVSGWEIPAERLSITVFGGHESLPPDEEAEEIWKAHDVPAERIYRFGPEDNFWGPPGVTGPCGPCSEIHYDLTQVPCSDPSCGPNCECGRFLEIWNLVFMEYNKQEQGNFDPLPSKNIDTGMGLERIALVLQRKEDIFATDLFSPILEAVEQICSFSLKDADEPIVRSSRVIADHIRAATFLVSDGVLPSNDGRGYVLRRILRKALVHGRRLGQTEPFVEGLMSVVIDNFQSAYPELADNRVFISRVLGSEEDRFLQTLETGIRIFQTEGERMEASGEKTLPGEVVFRLYDTFGFPPELTEDMAGERGMEVDRAGFEKCMAEQREKARASWRGDQQKGLTQEGALAGVQSEFIGYDRSEISSVVTHLFTEGQRTEEIGQGQEAQLVCSQTPFYAESGGQVGDRGLIDGPEGSFRVSDVQYGPGNVILHRGEVLRGIFREGQEVILKVDTDQRRSTERNHTATHLLHYALRTVLGDHVRQAGSLVAPDRLRFDFTHFAALEQGEIDSLESVVNQKILENQPLGIRTLPFAEAQAEKAIALFGEKYDDEVRMVSVQDYSKELCGGTHVSRTGDIGLFKILSEASVASGVRRIEALTGEGSFRHVQAVEKEYREVAQSLQARPGELADRLLQLQKRQKELEKSMKGKQVDRLKQAARELAEKAETLGEIPCVTAEFEADADTLRRLSDLIRDRLKGGVILLGSKNEGKALLILSVSKELTPRLHAGKLIKEAAQEVGGGGGGKPDMAQAGGSSPEKLDRAFQKLKDLVLAAASA
jgi:alanyl-tRNA synthetase